MILTQIFVLCIISSAAQEIVHCNATSQCEGSLQADILIGDGYNSISGLNTTINATNVYCMGSFACTDILHISYSTNIECHGSYTCSNVNKLQIIPLNTNTQTTSFIRCAGSESCSSSIITSSYTDTELLCNGYRSCTNATISGIQKIAGKGAYTLYNATIDSGYSIETLTVNLPGYNAGFGSRIICRSNVNCKINCKSNHCNVYCEGDGCNVDNVSETFLPTLFLETSINNDEECNQQQGQTANICCRASHSCYNMNNLKSSDRNNVICSGWESCKYTDIEDVTAAVYCEGSNACSSSTINATDNLYCSGSVGCWNATIHDVLNVYCVGYSSCIDSKMSTAGNGNVYSIYLVGASSAKRSQMHCQFGDKCLVFCEGSKSCEGSVLICDGNCTVKCNSDVTQCPIRVNATTVITATNSYNASLDIVSVSVVNNTMYIHEDNDGDGMLVIYIMGGVVACCVFVCLVLIIRKLQEDKQRNDANVRNMNAPVATEHQNIKDLVKSAELQPAQVQLSIVDDNENKIESDSEGYTTVIGEDDGQITCEGPEMADNDVNVDDIDVDEINLDNNDKNKVEGNFSITTAK